MRALRLAAALMFLAATTVACGDTRPALTFSPDALPDATVGVPYSAAITISGNQTPVGDFFPEASLPPGLIWSWDETVNRNIGMMTGTPTTAGTYQVTLSAWCLGTNVSGQTGSREYTLVVR